jgi:hypothetical protein
MYLGAKRTADMVMNSKTFKEMDIKFPETHFPGCEKYKFGSDQYWECFHRHCTLTIYHHVINNTKMMFTSISFIIFKCI